MTEIRNRKSYLSRMPNSAVGTSFLPIKTAKVKDRPGAEIKRFIDSNIYSEMDCNINSYNIFQDVFCFENQIVNHCLPSSPWKRDKMLI